MEEKQMNDNNEIIDAQPSDLYMEVEKIMGGKVLDYEAKIIYNKGKLELSIELYLKNRIDFSDVCEDLKCTKEEFESMVDKYLEEHPEKSFALTGNRR